MAAIPDVNSATIAIVGSSCAGLILLLSVVLLYFCCRRRRNYKEMEPGTQQRQQQHQQDGQISTEEAGSQQLHQGHHQQQQQRYHQGPDGKPYALVPPHPSLSADNVTTSVSGSRRSSSLMKEEAGEGAGGGSGDQHQRNTVFATLRSGHNPLDASSASNPTIFNYAQEYTDDSRNTDPYGFESGYRQGRKIVYEVVV